MKKFCIFLIAVFLIVVAGCSSDSSPEATEANADEKEMFKVGYMPNYASMNSVVAGIEAGLFDEYGLQVELIEFADGPTIISALESGSIDAGYIGPGAHVLPIQGQAKIFAFSHLGNADEVIGSKEKGVESIEDLKGKKIGVATGTSSETILDLALQEAGISESEVTLVNMDASAIVTAMISGGVDAVATWSPNTNTIKEEMGNGAIMLRNNSDYAEEFPSIASWVVSPSYADENGEKLLKFTKGLYKGVNYHIENEEDVVEWVAQQSAIDVDAVHAQTKDGDWKTSDEISEMLLDGTIEQYFKKQQENFIESGRLSEDDKVDVSEYVMFENMEKATE